MAGATIAICAALAACGTVAAAGAVAVGAAVPPGATRTVTSSVGISSGSRPGGSFTAAPLPGAGRSSRTVTIAFAGDVHFTGRTARLLRHPATAFGPIARVLRSADLTVLNLETAVTRRGVPQPKSYHFRTGPRAFAALADAGVDVATMANNHVLDYGRVGLADTLATARRAHFPVLGIGADAAAAWRPYLVRVNGVRIALLGVSQVAELASSWVATPTRSGEANAIYLRRTLAAVRAARKKARVVIVFMHWGTEGMSCPDPAQTSLARRLSAAGASIIAGSHAHMLQGSGWLGRTFVAYGMGNFLWWQHSYSTATGVLLLTLRPHKPLTWRFVPATVSRTGQPVPDRGAAARRARARYRALRACTGLSSRPGG